MELSYWQSRWQKNNIGWHMNDVHPQLIKLWPRLLFTSNPRVLVPLCGKNIDMQWMAGQGSYVIGVEISHRALQEFMDKQQQKFREVSSHDFKIYKSDSFELWEGDFFRLPTSKTPAIDLIYDKTSIVALPPDMRTNYAQKLLALCNADTQILLQTFEYPQEEMGGPPFSVMEEEVKELFGDRLQIDLMHEQSKLDEVSRFRQRGLSSFFVEKIYHLYPPEKS